jgi:hypothetical protein
VGICLRESGGLGRSGDFPEETPTRQGPAHPDPDPGDAAAPLFLAPAATPPSPVPAPSQQLCHPPGPGRAEGGEWAQEAAAGSWAAAAAGGAGAEMEAGWMGDHGPAGDVHAEGVHAGDVHAGGVHGDSEDVCTWEGLGEGGEWGGARGTSGCLGEWGGADGAAAAEFVMRCAADECVGGTVRLAQAAFHLPAPLFDAPLILALGLSPTVTQNPPTIRPALFPAARTPPGARGKTAPR